MYAYRCGTLDQDCLLHPDWTPVIFETRLGRDWQLTEDEHRLVHRRDPTASRHHGSSTVQHAGEAVAALRLRCANFSSYSSMRVYCSSPVEHACIIVQKRIRYLYAKISEQESKADSRIACENIQHGAFLSRIARASSQSLRACSVSRVNQHASRFGVGAPSRTPEVLRL